MTRQREFVRHTSWIGLEKAIRLGVGLTVGALVARYLGPADFGLLMFAQAVFGIAATLGGMGYDGIALKWFVENPAAHSLAGSVVKLRLTVAFFLITMIVVWSWFVTLEEYQLVAIVSLGLLGQSLLPLEQVHQARLRGGVGARCALGALGAGAIAKVGLVAVQGSLMMFGAAVALERILHGAFLAVTVRPSLPAMAKAPLAPAVRRLPQALPMIPVVFVGTVFVAVDQIMLKWLSSDSAIGFFAAASRLSEGIFMIMGVIATASFPLIADGVARDGGGVSRMRTLYLLVFLTGLSCGVAVWVAAPFIVRLLYGDSYDPATAVLRVHVWSAVFVGWRLVTGKWMIAAGQSWALMIRTGMGLMVNVGVGLLLIPRLGAVGAAWSSLGGHVFAGLLADLLNRQTRSQFALKMTSLASVKDMRSILRGFQSW